MTKTDSGVEVGRLSERVEVLEFREGTIPPVLRAEDAQDGGAVWGWETVRRTWGRAVLSERKNVYSVHGIGAAGVNFTLRRQSLDLDSALRWRGQHCLITAIRPLGRLYLTVAAALVELYLCRDPTGGTTFPAVMTEQYAGHQQLEPMAINTHRRVLVTPKAIKLSPGQLVEVAGEPWPIFTPYELDPHKNEYVIGRTVDI